MRVTISLEDLKYIFRVANEAAKSDRYQLLNIYNMYEDVLKEEFGCDYKNL